MARSPTGRPPVSKPGKPRPILNAKTAEKPVADISVPAKAVTQQAIQATPKPETITTPVSSPKAAPLPPTVSAKAPETPKAAPAPVTPAAPTVNAAPVIKATPPAAPVAPLTTAAIKAEPQAKPPQAAVDIAVTTKQESFKMADLKVPTAFADISEQARVAVEKSSKMIEEFNDFTKGNVEAFVAAGRAATKGAETLGQNAADFSRKSFEEASKAVKTLSAAKSPTEFFKLQTEFTKSQFDSLIAEASKVSESFLKIFGDISEPLSTRMAVAADKVKTVIK